jgi:hypothetical protein
MTAGMNRSYVRRTGRKRRANIVSSKIQSSGSAVNIESPPDAISVSTRQLIRMGGLALFVGGVLWGLAKAAWGFLVLPSGDPNEYPQPTGGIRMATTGQNS